MFIKATTNPVGEVKEVKAVEEAIGRFTAIWDQENGATKRSWWGFLTSFSSTRPMVKVTTFLIKALDDLINLVDEELENGADKKATVLWAVSKLYDYVAAEALPIWLHPFSSQVKGIVINTIISAAIDWIVDKYKNGDWRKNLPTQELG